MYTMYTGAICNVYNVCNVLSVLYTMYTCAIQYAITVVERLILITKRNKAGLHDYRTRSLVEQDSISTPVRTQ